jgi:hypothetical protein
MRSKVLWKRNGLLFSWIEKLEKVDFLVTRSWSWEIEKRIDSLVDWKFFRE